MKKWGRGDDEGDENLGGHGVVCGLCGVVRRRNSFAGVNEDVKRTATEIRRLHPSRRWRYKI